MPGYNIDRFVDITESERDVMQCCICQDILRDPVVAPCCRQMFCKQCISEWLKANDTCPYDRKTLLIASLTEPPKVLENMLMNFKITCDYKDNGCNEVLKLDQLSKHIINCQYKICERCDCVKQPNHDCVDTLLNLNKKANEEICELKDKLIIATKQLDDRSPTPCSSNNFALINMCTETQLFDSAREHITSIEVIRNRKFYYHETERIKDCTFTEILANSSLLTFCRQLRKKLHDVQGNNWHVSAGQHNAYCSFYAPGPGKYMCLKIGLMSISIYSYDD